MEQRDLGRWLGEVERRTGMRSEMSTLTLVRRVIEALEEVLLGDELATLRSCLPTTLAHWVPPQSTNVGSSVQRMIRRVQRLELAPAPVVLERVEVVCRALGETLPPDVQARWRRDLPTNLAALFMDVGPGETRPPATGSALVVHCRASRPDVPTATLASGRPGSDHPLSESQPEQTHAHSVARSDDPHADTRLSSSRGLTQERERSTLAEGSDPSDRRS